MVLLIVEQSGKKDSFHYLLPPDHLSALHKNPTSVLRTQIASSCSVQQQLTEASFWTEGLFCLFPLRLGGKGSCYFLLVWVFFVFCAALYNWCCLFLNPLFKKVFKVSTVPSTYPRLVCGIMPAAFVLIAGFIRQMTDTRQIKTVVRSYVRHSHY